MDGIMTILLTIVILVGVVTIIYIVNFNNLQAYKIKINEAESIIDDLEILTTIPANTLKKLKQKEIY